MVIRQSVGHSIVIRFGSNPASQECSRRATCVTAPSSEWPLAWAKVRLPCSLSISICCQRRDKRGTGETRGPGDKGEDAMFRVQILKMQTIRRSELFIARDGGLINGSLETKCVVPLITILCQWEVSWGL